MRVLHPLLGLGLAAVVPSVAPFAPPATRKTASLAVLRARSGSGRDAAPLGEGPAADMLTACAVETVGFLYEQVREKVKKDWILGFFQEHFTEAPATKGFLRTLMRTEPESVFVQQVRRKRQGSPGNPFIDQQKPVFTYTVLVEPRAEAERLMDRREIMAAEWLQDLERIRLENDEIVRHYRERGTQRRRIALGMEIDGPLGSPNRRKYYGELKAIVTERGLARAVEQLRSTHPRGEKWLSSMMEQAAAKGWSGDELLEGIIRGPMVLLPPKRDGKMRVIEPEKITAVVMESRMSVADEWAAELRQVSEVHRMLRAERLGEQFGGEVNVDA